MSNRPAAGPADEGARLLLVEDNNLHQMVAVEVLTRLGYRTDVSANGKEAIAMAQTTQYRRS